MWVFGLCDPCNNLASRYDAAYGDFATITARFMTSAGRRLARSSYELPAVALAPGLVARSVLYGMFAIAPRLRIIVPQFARALLRNDGDIQWPSQLRLRLALTRPPLARLAGHVLSQRVLGYRTGYHAHGEIYFPPFAWVLNPSDGGQTMDEVGWADASEWIRYGGDRTAVDLRHLVSRLPIVRHPQHASDEWMHFMSDEITPLLDGYIPA
jgi:hypothetical protein